MGRGSSCPDVTSGQRLGENRGMGPGQLSAEPASPGRGQTPGVHGPDPRGPPLGWEGPLSGGGCWAYCEHLPPHPYSKPKPQKGGTSKGLVCREGLACPFFLNPLCPPEMGDGLE